MQPRDNREYWFKGQGLWADVPVAQWRDWRWQYRHRLSSPEQLEQLLHLSPSERAGCLLAGERLSLAITPYFFNLINRDDPECPIRRQVVPREEETHISPGEREDPVGEDKTMPVPGLVHRYPDRVLFLV
ncbi:MAG: lysine 2,3-aminomutase, partial [Puniceicoccales bacterium]|nr:lysine 2,3-aminomutase [Puniceicoccales bacterium]